MLYWYAMAPLRLFKHVFSGENTLMDDISAPRGWRNPTVIAAIVTAIAAIIVAIIGLAPKFMSSGTPAQSTIIEQKTSGPRSPAVGQTGGDVTITNEQPSIPKK